MVHYNRLNQHEKSNASIHLKIQGSQNSVSTTPILERGKFWQNYVKSNIKCHRHDGTLKYAKSTREIDCKHLFYDSWFTEVSIDHAHFGA